MPFKLETFLELLGLHLIPIQGKLFKSNEYNQIKNRIIIFRLSRERALTKLGLPVQSVAIGGQLLNQGRILKNSSNKC